MIRFRRLFELVSDVDRRRFSEASELFRTAFPHEADAVDRIAHMLLNRRTIGFDPILLLSTDARDRASTKQTLIELVRHAIARKRQLGG